MIEEAISIERKIDDGLPETGNIRAVAAGNNVNVAPLGKGDTTVDPQRCTVSSGSTYASPQTNNHRRCALVFKMGQ
jgi:hypothetical protein